MRVRFCALRCECNSLSFLRVSGAVKNARRAAKIAHNTASCNGGSTGYPPAQPIRYPTAPSGCPIGCCAGVGAIRCFRPSRKQPIIARRLWGDACNADEARITTAHGNTGETHHACNLETGHFRCGMWHAARGRCAGRLHARLRIPLLLLRAAKSDSRGLIQRLGAASLVLAPLRFS